MLDGQIKKTGDAFKKTKRSLGPAVLYPNTSASQQLPFWL
jgi:hypothetical protein